MKQTIKIFTIIVLVLFFSACQSNNPKKVVYSEIKKADKLEIVNFHSTYQCYSCVYIGETTLKILEKKFSQEIEQGKISFLKLNVDKRENPEIINRYNPRGSSLFFNSIIDNQDNITEDVNIWRLIGKDKEFEEYIVDKINKLIN